MKRTLGALLACANLAGCEVLADVADGVEAPEAQLNRVDLLHAPEALELVNWQCAESLGSTTCAIAGLDDTPRKKDLEYQFDLVFDLSNPNKKLPIPLVEILLGINVYDDQNLGRACISFCDPDQEDCAPTTDAEGSCLAEEADEVDSFDDLIPTVDDLVEIGEAALDNDLDNGDWRYIPGGDTIEAHIQFDLSADVMLDLGDELLNDALDDAINGRNIKVEVPYAADGTVFFDVPELGRKAIGFGPAENEWVVQ